MAHPYAIATQHFSSIIDFLRFGLSKATEESLYYGHGTDNAWDDIFALVLGSLSLPLDVDPLLLQGRLTSEEATHLCQQLEQRICNRVPVPYLTHEAYFCDLSFYVAEKVERVLDLCTGSGCIAIACSAAFPDAWVDASDLSPEALTVADINRARYGLEEVVTLIESDCFSAIPATRYDIIVSNPPYVSFDEMDTLPEEYRHEPKLALQAEANGLVIVEKILRHAHAYLSEHGILVVEVGNSEQALVDAYPHVPFTWLDFEQGGHGVFVLTAQQLREYF